MQASGVMAKGSHMLPRQQQELDMGADGYCVQSGGLDFDQSPSPLLGALSACKVTSTLLP